MTPNGVERSVLVEPASAPAYRVRIGPGVAPAFAGELAGVLGAGPAKLLAVVDAGVPGEWVDRTLSAYAGAGFDVGRLVIEPSEQAKSLETFRIILDALAVRRQERREPVLAIGGGIVGDIAGFAASCWRRGVPVVHCPTTLLAGVDASVGGKTGVNLPLGSGDLLKNMVGSFHQPRAVLADTDALRSLSPRQMRAGLAECFKHGLIAAEWGDADLWSWMIGSAGAVLGHDAWALVECIARNVAVKARVVAADEREQSDTGGRALLNLGHTYAHAMETIEGLRPGGDPPPLLHGEAVSLGLVAATACSAALGLVESAMVDDVRSALASAGLPVSIAGLPGEDALLRRMLHDKKADAGAIRLALPVGPGRAALVRDPDPSAISAGWSAIRAGG